MILSIKLKDLKKKVSVTNWRMTTWNLELESWNMEPEVQLSLTSLRLSGALESAVDPVESSI